jgi:hypothetical protein
MRSVLLALWFVVTAVRACADPLPITLDPWAEFPPIDPPSHAYPIDPTSIDPGGVAPEPSCGLGVVLVGAVVLLRRERRCA